MFRPARTHREHLARKFRQRFFVEALEDRNLLDCGLGGTLLEDFNDPSLSSYSTIIRYWPSAFVYNGAGCDGGNALIDYDGDDWTIRNDAGSRVNQGDLVVGAVYLGGARSGRAYLGFGSIVPAVNDHLTTGRTLAVVLAPNTNQFMIQQSLGYKLHSSTYLTTVANASGVPYQMDQWYFVFAWWGVGGGVAAYLYDINGNQVAGIGGSAASYPNTSGGLAFRGFGDNAYYIWDGITKYTGFAPGGAPEGFIQKFAASHSLPADRVPQIPATLGEAPSSRGVPNPFNYTSVPGTDRDIQLENLSGLGMTSCTPGSGPSCLPDNTFNGMVGLTTTNTSRNMANRTVAWGPSLVNHFSFDTPQNTPNYEQYMYRLDPGTGQQAIRIGQSGIKAFWSSTWGYDYQFIAPAGTPGDQDTYGTGNNSNRSSFAPDSVLNPYTGERYDYSGMGTRNTDGLWVLSSRTYTSPFQNLLEVSATGLNPALHPGARYFVAANIFVVGDRNVANNSRWLEYTVTATAQPNRYNFTPVGSQRLDICTLPGLVPVGRCGTGAPGVPGGDGETAPVDPGQVLASTLLAETSMGPAPALLSAAPAEGTRNVPVATVPVDQVFASQTQQDEAALLQTPAEAEAIGWGNEFALELGGMGGGC